MKRFSFNSKVLAFASQTTVICVFASELAHLIIFGSSDFEELRRELISGFFITILVAFPVAIFVGNQREKLRSLADKLGNFAHLDPLTGLSNRRHFFDQLEITLNRGNKSPGVLLLDLYDFKLINDVYGHRAGDEVLIETAQRLTSVLPEGAFAARLGGDEFGICLRGPLNAANIAEFGALINEALAPAVFVTGGEAKISTGIGAAIRLSSSQSVEELFDCADYALYEGKKAKLTEPVLFSATHQGKILFIKSIEREMRKAEFLGQLHLLFHPIVDIRTDRLKSVEALVRWTSPVLGEVSPVDFIPVAERIGLITNITEAVFHLSIAEMDNLPAGIGMSMNLSALDLVSPISVLKIAAVLQQRPSEARNYYFEITETAFATDNEQATASLRLLRSTGARISVDDFGTGYSNLNKLHLAQWNVIKLDRCFVFDVNRHREKRAIIRALVALGAELNMEIVVEGVETANHMAIVKDLGVTQVQGYFYGKPQPMHSLLKQFDLTTTRRSA